MTIIITYLAQKSSKSDAYPVLCSGLVCTFGSIISSN